MFEQNFDSPKASRHLRPVPQYRVTIGKYGTVGMIMILNAGTDAQRFLFL